MMVIGHPQAVLGFSLVGVDGVAATTTDEANQALDSALAAQDVGVILVTEDVATWVGPRMDQLKQRSTIPLVVEVPAPGGPRQGQPSLGEVVFRAIGVKL